VLFGGSIIDEQTEPSNDIDMHSCTLERVLEEWNPQLIAVREPLSYQKLQSLSFPATAQTILSADLTHSIQLAPASLEFWKEYYNDPDLYRNMYIVFPRANNAKQSIAFKGRKVVLEVWTEENNNSTVTLQGQNVVFATSSAIEDENMFLDWMYQYYDRFKVHQFVVCNTVEQLFGLISNARHVYTDRYHPGVAAFAQGIDFTILRYEQERTKLIGLRDMVYKDKYAAAAVRGELNAKAFAQLGSLLKKASRGKRKV